MTRIPHESQTDRNTDWPCDDYIDECPLREHFSDVHHMVWDRSSYKKGSLRKLRERPELKIQMCRLAHIMIHDLEIAPPVPTQTEAKKIVEQYNNGEL